MIKYKNRLAFYRRRRGVGLRELARRVGLNAGYLSRIEHGERWPTLQMRRRISLRLRAGYSRVFPQKKARRVSR